MSFDLSKEEKRFFFKFSRSFGKYFNVHSKELSNSHHLRDRARKLADFSRKYNEFDLLPPEALDFMEPFVSKFRSWLDRNSRKHCLESEEWFIKNYVPYFFESLLEKQRELASSVSLFLQKLSKREPTYIPFSFIGSVDVSDRLNRLWLVDLSEPSKVDWRNLFDEKLLFLNGYVVDAFDDSILGDKPGVVLVSEGQFYDLLSLGRTFTVAYNEYLYVKFKENTISFLRKRRAELWQSFVSADSEESRTNLRFEIGEIDNEIAKRRSIQ